MAGSSELASLTVKLEADVSEFKTEMARIPRLVQDSTDEIKKAAESVNKEAGESFLNFSHIVNTALGVFTGEVLYEGIKHVGEAVYEFFHENLSEGIEKAKEAESSIVRMNFALASAGHYSKESSHEMIEFAEEMHKMSGAEKDTIISSMATIEVLGGLSNEGLKKATIAALDLSAAMKIDLTSATTMVAKAAEGQVGALQRLIGHIEKGATNAETFSNAMQAMSRFSGAAAASLNTYEGANKLLNSSMGEAQKALGEVIVKNQLVIVVIKEVARLFGELEEYVKENQQAMREYVATGISYAIEGLHAMNGAFEIVRGAVTGLYYAFKELGVGVFGVLQGLVEGPMLLMLKAIQAINGTLHLADPKQLQTAIDGLGKSMQATADSFFKAGGDMTEALTKPSHASVAIENALLSLDKKSKEAFDQVTSGADSSTNYMNKTSVAAKAAAAEISAMATAGQKLIQGELEKDDPGLKYKREVNEMKAAVKEKLATQEEMDKTLEVRRVDEAKLAAEELAKENLKELELLISKNEAMTSLNDSFYTSTIAANNKRITQLQAGESKLSSHYINEQVKKQNAEMQLNALRVSATNTMFQNIATATKSHGEAGFEVSRGASAAQAIMQTYQGATGAFSAMSGIPFVGPALGFIAAAAAIAAGFANVEKIYSTHMAGGMTSIPGVGTLDNFPAMLAPNERVVSGEQNKDLTSFLSGESSMVKLLAAIHEKLSDNQPAPITVQIGGKVLIDTLNDEMLSGRRLVF